MLAVLGVAEERGQEGREAVHGRCWRGGLASEHFLVESPQTPVTECSLADQGLAQNPWKPQLVEWVFDLAKSILFFPIQFSMTVRTNRRNLLRVTPSLSKHQLPSCLCRSTHSVLRFTRREKRREGMDICIALSSFSIKMYHHPWTAHVWAAGCHVCGFIEVTPRSAV